jgi:glycosyl transferase family 87
MQSDDPQVPVDRRRALNAAAIAAALIAVLVLGVKYVRQAQRPTHETGGTALADYLEAGRRADGGEVYAMNFSYPPLFAIAMEPLAALPPRVAATLWYLLQVAALASILCLALRALRAMHVPRPALVLVLATLASSRFLLNNLLHGNVNAFVLLLALAGVADLSSRREARAGLALAAAATVKLLPLLFLPALMLRRSWKAAATMLLSLAVLNAGLPALLVGPERALDLSGAWYRKMVEPYYETSVPGDDERNLALAAMLQRHFEGLRDSPAADVLIKGTLAAIAAVALLVVWRNRREPTLRRWLVDAAVLLTTMLLISPKTWKAHYVWLFPAFLILCADVVAGWRSTLPSARAFRWTVLIVALLGALSSRGVVGRAASDALRHAGVETLVAFSIWLLLVVRASRRSGFESAQDGAGAPVDPPFDSPFPRTNPLLAGSKILYRPPNLLVARPLAFADIWT